MSFVCVCVRERTNTRGVYACIYARLQSTSINTLGTKSLQPQWFHTKQCLVIQDNWLAAFLFLRYISTTNSICIHLQHYFKRTNSVTDLDYSCVWVRIPFRWKTISQTILSSDCVHDQDTSLQANEPFAIIYGKKEQRESAIICLLQVSGIIVLKNRKASVTVKFVETFREHFKLFGYISQNHSNSDTNLRAYLTQHHSTFHTR